MTNEQTILLGECLHAVIMVDAVRVFVDSAGSAFGGGAPRGRVRSHNLLAVEAMSMFRALMKEWNA